jgi:hypothetical protein
MYVPNDNSQPRNLRTTAVKISLERLLRVLLLLQAFYAVRSERAD